MARRVRFLPGPRAGVARCNLHKAACAEQLAQSKLRRATCADQLAPTSLRRAPCLEQLAQSNLRRATCTEQLAQSSLHRATCREQLARSNLHRATCRQPLAGTNLHRATCAEQLAPSNLCSATCVEQLAQTNLHRPVCAELLAWCCLALASRMLRVGKMNASCSVACDVILSGQPWSSFFFVKGAIVGCLLEDKHTLLLSEHLVVCLQALRPTMVRGSALRPNEANSLCVCAECQNYPDTSL